MSKKKISKSLVEEEVKKPYTKEQCNDLLFSAFIIIDAAEHLIKAAVENRGLSAQYLRTYYTEWEEILKIVDECGNLNWSEVMDSIHERLPNN